MNRPNTHYRENKHFHIVQTDASLEDKSIFNKLYIFMEEDKWFIRFLDKLGYVVIIHANDFPFTEESDFDE